MTIKDYPFQAGSSLSAGNIGYQTVEEQKLKRLLGILHKGTKVVYNFEHRNWPQKGTKSAKGFDLNSCVCFLVPMLQRGNAYHMGSHAGAWEPGKNDHLKCKPENEGFP